MNILPTNIPDVLRIQLEIFRDERGFFIETYQKKKFEQTGIPYEFVQDNRSSSKKSTIRGLHYQISHTQGKLISVIVGEIFDVAVDLRQSSPYYGKWVGAYLSAENIELFWIPPGFAHGFYTLSERADVLYKVTDYYDPSGERCIRWDDPTLAIDWPIPDNVVPLLSNKDASAPLFKDAEVFT